MQHAEDSNARSNACALFQDLPPISPYFPAQSSASHNLRVTILITFDSRIISNTVEHQQSGLALINWSSYGISWPFVVRFETIDAK